MGNWVNTSALPEVFENLVNSIQTHIGLVVLCVIASLGIISLKRKSHRVIQAFYHAEGSD